MQCINDNNFETLIDNDIFYVLNQWLQQLDKDNPKLPEVFNTIHLIVRNCKNENNLQLLLQTKGFVQFVQNYQQFHDKNLFYDFVTFFKKVIEKIDQSCLFEHIQFQIEKLLEYYNTEENLINTQIKSIYLSIIQSSNQQIIKFTSTKKFKYYVFIFHQQLKEILLRMQQSIDESKILQIKKIKSQLDDFLYFLDDWINLQQDQKQRLFQINIFFLQFILNIFQNYLIQNKNVQEINLPVIFYAVNNFLYITKKSENEIFEFFQKYFKNFPICCNHFQNLILQIEKQGLGFFLQKYDEILELENFCIFDENDKIEQVAQNDLFSFVKTKDDNLVLQTTNLLLQISSMNLLKDSENLLKNNLLNRLTQQPLMRQVTFEKCFKLLDHLQLNQEDQKLMQIIGDFIIQNLNQQFLTDQGRELIANFRRYILQNEELLENIHPQFLKETSLINYLTLEDQKQWIKDHQKELKFTLDFEEQYRVFICLFQIWAELYIKYFPEILKIEKIQKIFQQNKSEIEYLQMGENVNFNLEEPPMQIFLKGKEQKTKQEVCLGFLNHYFYFFLKDLKNENKGQRKLMYKCHFTDIYYQKMQKKKSLLFFSQDKSLNLILKFKSKEIIEKTPEIIKQICDQIIENEKKLLQSLIKKFIKQFQFNK